LNVVDNFHYLIKSACMESDHKAVGSISDTSKILNVDYIWNGVHSASWGQLGT
jgi:hypothetical protein